VFYLHQKHYELIRESGGVNRWLEADIQSRSITHLFAMRLELSVERFLVIGGAMDRGCCSASVDSLSYTLCYVGGTIVIFGGAEVLLFCHYLTYPGLSIQNAEYFTLE
jgi:hypothetical protein